jgi:hypothetical protein
MLGDDPIVIAVVVLFLGAFVAFKFRRKDPRRCPQCQHLAFDLIGPKGPAAPAGLECRHCGTALARDSRGNLRRR